MAGDASAYVPTGAQLGELRDAAQGCRGCGLYRGATQAVLGEGDVGAPVLLLGEQPGDQEDRQGRPFVGPAGRVLTRGLADAGIDPARTFRTNVVKHFKFGEVRGKRRIHERPDRSEVVACRPWLVAEVSLVQPEVVVCLGATAAQSVLGTSFRVTKERGKVLDCPDLGGSHQPDVVVATVHPASVLRADDRRAAYDAFVADLEIAGTCSRTERSAHADRTRT